MKNIQTPINGIHYSTPDFYPRWAYNWRKWTGAWHGWAWIEEGRQVEIKDGDYLFSPFVAAGWAQHNEANITPGQWLGLLKSLSVVGAEFYYVGFFNLSPPFPKPGDYIWQAAMPAYAQAITSRFEDVLKDGNVLFDEKGEPILRYQFKDSHVLITARKKNGKERYVICGTYQPFSNDSMDIPERKNESVTINGNKLAFEIRRQGSVYVYEKLANRTIFYQLDSWHQNAHPDRWSKDYYTEAEVSDSGISSEDIYTITNDTAGNYTHFTSYIHMPDKKECLYHFAVRDTMPQSRYIWIKCRGKGDLSIRLSNDSIKKGVNTQLSIHKESEWEWVKADIPKAYFSFGSNRLLFIMKKGEADIDKVVITTNPNIPAY